MVRDTPLICTNAPAILPLIHFTLGGRGVIMRTTYYDHSGPRKQTGYRGFGEAWAVSPTEDRPSDLYHSRLPLSEALCQSLSHLGLDARFNALPHLGVIGAYEEGALTSTALVQAIAIVRDAAESLPSGFFEWSCATQLSPEPIEYRITVSGSDLKAQLLLLSNFIEESHRQNYWVQLWL
jgi:hypothetical protein